MPTRMMNFKLLTSDSGRLRRFFRGSSAAVMALWLTAVLSGCSSDVMAPAGDIAVRLRNVMGVTTFLMLLIVIPVMVAVCIFAWQYRASNKHAKFDPDFHHSTSLELLIWAAPLTIVVWLGAITWVSTHQLDPYRPLDRIDGRTEIDPNVKPLVIQTVSLDWKWLFIYPEYGIATVNEVAAPIDRPIKFELTSSDVMNAFHVPALAGMIYTMASMQTTLWAVGNDKGVYDGRSSHYSGAGFSGMSFKFHVLEQSEFDDWIGKAATGEVLDRERYFKLAEPSEKVPPMFFSLADAKLYHDILNRCLQPGEVCMDEQMSHGDSSNMEHSSRRAIDDSAVVTSAPVFDADDPMCSREERLAVSTENADLLADIAPFISESSLGEQSATNTKQQD